MSKIKVEIDADLEDLIPQFLENRKKDIEVLQQLIEKNDLTALAQLAHKVKGAATSYGFAELGELASQIEMQAKSNQSHQLPELIQKMKTHFLKIEVHYVPM
ncbi:MAG: Hpt domain-containing protein [Pseudobdellovibrionaceae bacterium]